MEFFERAHTLKKESSEDRKTTEMKKQLKQMLFGYKANDNKLIQKSTETQNDYEDSTSVSGYSDLNLTISSVEDQNASFISNRDTSSSLIDPDSFLKEKFSEDSDSVCSGSNEDADNASTQVAVSSDNESEDKLGFNEVKCEENTLSSVNNDSVTDESDEFGDKIDLDSGTDSETSIVISELNLSDSDNSEFDVDRQLAAKIKERLQIKNNEQNKYTLKQEGNVIAKSPITQEHGGKTQTQNLLSMADDRSSTQRKGKKRKHKDKLITLNENDISRGPITKERCIEIEVKKLLQVNKDKLTLIKKNKQKHRDKYTIILSEKQKRKQKYNAALDNVNSVGPLNIEILSNQEDNELLSVSSDDLSRNGNEHFEVLNDEAYEESNDGIDSVMSPAYVSISASDMSTKKLDEIVGEYKHSTIRNLPSENSNIFSTINSAFLVQENMNVAITLEDDVSSLIPELDDIPRVEDIDEELIVLDTSKEVPDKSMNTSNTLESEIIEQGSSMDSENAADAFKVYYGTNCCIVTLKHPSKLFIQGKVRIKSLAGTLELFGYTLNNENYNIYAPYYNFAQCIKTVENENDYFGLFGKLTAAGLTVQEAEDIVTKIEEHDGVILLKKLKEKVIDFVENNFRVTNMFKLNKTIEPYFNKVCNLLDCSLFSSRPYKSFREHPSWSEVHELAMSKYSRGIVCGGKGAGKSTYMRYQVNKLLSHGPVLVVDLDPGQSLFTVAGNLSATVVTSPLFGPTFTHLRKPKLYLRPSMLETVISVCLKDLRIATNVVVKKEHIMKVLNGKLVALCQHASDTALFTLTDKPLVCRGHGLIRGVDWDKEMLYMITPVPSDELGSVDTLVYADWAPELLWHESQLPLGTVLPYRTSTENKQLMSTPRRRFNNPLQLLKMAGGVPN
ncbi:jg10296 [Pararge aegeria aegeria]|uniref:Polynucleotide 5'-hydroxyl-kinase NOL9 n=1 Tax=Pararge aegeria aegeria TaxID=348720 RepID=A0A8S4SD23_9NEOP|nr:jg10296 [Pararge aegeria aegeria]